MRYECYFSRSTSYFNDSKNSFQQLKKNVLNTPSVFGISGMFRDPKIHHLQNSTRQQTRKNHPKIQNPKGDSSRKPKTFGTRPWFSNSGQTKGFLLKVWWFCFSKKARKSCTKLRIEWHLKENDVFLWGRGGLETHFHMFFNMFSSFFFFDVFRLSCANLLRYKSFKQPPNIKSFRIPKKIVADTPLVLRSFFISKQWSPRSMDKGGDMSRLCPSSEGPVKFQVLRVTRQESFRKKVFACFGSIWGWVSRVIKGTHFRVKCVVVLRDSPWKIVHCLGWCHIIRPLHYSAHLRFVCLLKILI